MRIYLLVYGAAGWLPFRGWGRARARTTTPESYNPPAAPSQNHPTISVKNPTMRISYVGDSAPGCGMTFLCAGYVETQCIASLPCTISIVETRHVSMPPWRCLVSCLIQKRPQQNIHSPTAPSQNHPNLIRVIRENRRNQCSESV